MCYLHNNLNYKFIVEGGNFKIIHEHVYVLKTLDFTNRILIKPV